MASGAKMHNVRVFGCEGMVNSVDIVMKGNSLLANMSFILSYCVRLEYYFARGWAIIGNKQVEVTCEKVLKTCESTEGGVGGLGTNMM